MTEVRFCPFCKEPFDGEKCPDHGLALVRLVDLASVDRIPHETERLAPTDFRFGRRRLVLGAFVVLVGFGLPVVIDGSRGDESTTAFDLWQFRADYLGVVPAAAVTIVVLAFLRRTRRDLVRARLAMAVALAIATTAAAVAAFHVVEYSRHLDAIGAENGLRPSYGGLVVAVGVAILAWGVATLGRADAR